MPQTKRIYYWNAQGRIRANYNWDPITKKSAVLITAAEALPLPPNALGPNFFICHLGAADVYVTNISPQDGGVEFIIHADWSSPLPILVDITVLDPYIDYDIVSTQ
jgi:hypothetical protein